MAVDKYIPLIDEVIIRNPVAVRLNAIRLGLGDESFQLSRQTLMVSISEWKTKNNATEQDVANMIREVLSVESALNVAIEELINKKPQNGFNVPNWMLYVSVFLLVLGFITALGGGFRLVKKIFQ